MTPFSYVCPNTVDEAIQSYAQAQQTRFIGGGTNLLDLMKMGVEKPAHLIDINHLPLTKIEPHGDGVRIGALARISHGPRFWVNDAPKSSLGRGHDRR